MLRRLFLVLPLFILTACGAPAPTGPPVELRKPPPGKAQVYIIRPRTMVGSGNLMITRVNGAPVSQLQVGQYTIVPVQPGETVLSMRSKIQGPLPVLVLRALQEAAGFQEIGRVNLAAGQTAYMDYHWVRWTDAEEASRLIGAGPTYVPPVGPAGPPA